MGWDGMGWDRMGWDGRTPYMVWCGVVWYGVVWCGVAWYGMVWYGMVWYGMGWYRVVWCGMVWYGMVWDRIGSDRIGLDGLGWVGLGCEHRCTASGAQPVMPMVHSQWWAPRDGQGLQAGSRRTRLTAFVMNVPAFRPIALSHSMQFSLRRNERQLRVSSRAGRAHAKYQPATLHTCEGAHQHHPGHGRRSGSDYGCIHKLLTTVSEDDTNTILTRY